MVVDYTTGENECLCNDWMEDNHTNVVNRNDFFDSQLTTA